MSISSLSRNICSSTSCSSLPFALTTLAAAVSLIASLVIGAPLFLTIICSVATLASLIAWYTAPDRNFMAMGRDSREKADQIFRSTCATQESLETVDSLLTKARLERERANEELQRITQLSRKSDQSSAETRGHINSLEITADQLTLAQQTEKASLATLQDQNHLMVKTAEIIGIRTSNMGLENGKLKEALAEQTKHVALLTQALSQMTQHNQERKKFTETAQWYINSAPAHPTPTTLPLTAPLILAQ